MLCHVVLCYVMSCHVHDAFIDALSNVKTLALSVLGVSGNVNSNAA